MKKLYTSIVTAIGGRDGYVESANGVLNLEVKSPKQLGGASDDFPNPEMLFAAGYAACFGSALEGVIRRQKIETGTTSVQAEVSLGKLNDTAYGLEVKLNIIIPGIQQSVAEKLVETAHQICPYSNAIRNNVAVQLNVTTNKL